MSKAPQAPTGLQQGDAAHIWRWIPSKTRRAQGWKALTLKDPDTGKHLSLPDAWRACEHINALVEASEAGQSVHGMPWAHVAPLSLRKAPEIASGRSLGALLDAYLASPAFTTKEPNTQTDIKQRLRRLFEILAGLHSGEPKRTGMPRRAYTRALTRYRHWMAQVRALPIEALIVLPKTPEEIADDIKRGIVPEPSNLERAYHILAGMINERTGKPQIANAAAIMRYARAWLEWVRKRLRANWPNPVELIENIVEPDGRIVIWSKDEIKTLLDACHRAGWHSVAFACELALELSWSQTDILNLKWSQIRNGRVLNTRSKTGIKTETTLTKNGRDIIARIRAHYAGDDASVAFLPTDYVIRVDKRDGHSVREAAGKQWNRHYFRQTFIALRNSINWTWDVTKTFQDFRDTAITIMWEAGLDFPEIASRTQHSLTHIQKVIEKHYGKITRVIADRAAAKLDIYHDAAI